MRIVSIITAALVAVALYAIVFERDRVLSFAQRESEPSQAVDENGDATPETPAGTEEAVRKVSVVVLESSADTVDNAVILRGQTAAARQVDVKSEVSGLIVSEPLRKGSFVSAGETLCKIETGTRLAQLAEAEARMEDARISSTAAERLAEGGFGSETRKLAANATLQGAQAAVDLAKKEIDRLTIAAPFEGILESDTAEIGSLMQPGLLCGTVIQLDPIKLVAFLPETAIDKVKLGAAARANLGSGREVAGLVTFISRSADPETRTFRVEIETPNPDLSISDGQTADIAIAADGVLAHMIPASALTLDDHGTMGLRLVDDENKVRFTPVSVVRDSLDGVLLTGLPENARVIVVGQEYVNEGVEVTVTLRGSDS